MWKLDHWPVFTAPHCSPRATSGISYSPLVITDGVDDTLPSSVNISAAEYPSSSQNPVRYHAWLTNRVWTITLISNYRDLSASYQEQWRHTLFYQNHYVKCRALNFTQSGFKQYVVKRQEESETEWQKRDSYRRSRGRMETKTCNIQST